MLRLDQYLNILLLEYVRAALVFVVRVMTSFPMVYARMLSYCADGESRLHIGENKAHLFKGINGSDITIKEVRGPARDGSIDASIQRQ